jgi:chaperone required for assembly of F1-ATPase
MSETPRDPMRSAQANMRPAAIKRFYRTVDVREGAGGRHALTLDGRNARTPGRRPLAAKSRALMLEVAAEWERQRETIEAADMPLTRLLNAAVDGVAFTMAETRAEILKYAGSDLLCYRAEEPEELAERQRLAFDPILAWAAETLGVRFNLVAGIMHVEQPAQAIEAVRSAIANFADPVALAALSAMTTLAGSALLALAVARGRLSPEEAWRAAHVDEDFQAERWGADEEARARREARWREFEAAALAAGASG